MHGHDGIHYKKNETTFLCVPVGTQRTYLNGNTR